MGRIVVKDIVGAIIFFIGYLLLSYFWNGEWVNIAFPIVTALLFFVITFIWDTVSMKKKK